MEVADRVAEETFDEIAECAQWSDARFANRIGIGDEDTGGFVPPHRCRCRVNTLCAAGPHSREDPTDQLVIDRAGVENLEMAGDSRRQRTMH